MKGKKILKWVSILLGVFFVLLFVILGIASFYLSHNKKKVIAFAENKIEDATGGIAKISDINVSIWRNFPRLQVGLEGVQLLDSVYHKPLILLNDVHTGVNVLSAIMGHYKVSKLIIDGGRFHLFTDSTGYSNSYLLSGNKTDQKETNKKSGDMADIGIDQLTIKDFVFLLENKKENKRIGVTINDMKSHVEKSGDKFLVDLKQDLFINGLGFNLQNGSFLKDMPMSVHWENMQFDSKTKKLSFDPSRVFFNDTLYTVGGWFNFSSDSATSHMHLDVQSQNTTFHHAGTLLAQNIQTKLNQFKWKGPIDVNATLDGSLKQSTPSIQVKAVAKNSTLILPQDAAIIDSANFVGYYDNQAIHKNELPTDPNSQIRIENFSGSWNGATLKTVKPIVVSNLELPYLDILLASHANLDVLSKSLGLETIKLTKGQVDMKFGYKGQIVDDIRVIERFSGSLVVKNGAGIYLPRQFPFSNCNGVVNFGQSALTIKNLVFDLKKNHFVVNLNGVKKKGSDDPNLVCNVYSTGIDLGDFLTVFDNGTTSTTSTSTHSKPSLSRQTLPIDQAMNQGSLQVNIKADKVFYHHFRGKNFDAQMRFTTTNWSATKLSIQQDGGLLSITAKVKRNPKFNDVFMDVKMSNMDIQKTLYGFDNFGLNGISYQNLSGRIDLKGNLSTKINDAGSLVQRATTGHFDFLLRNGRLRNYEPLMKVQKYVFKKRNLNDIQFAPIQSKLDINNGDIHISRLEIASTALRLFVEGVYSPTGNTNIQIQVPLKSLLSKSSKSVALDKTDSEEKVGASLYLNAKSKNGGPVKMSLDAFHFLKKDKNKKDE